jgi:hypothetical protein
MVGNGCSRKAHRSFIGELYYLSHQRSCATANDAPGGGTEKVVNYESAVLFHAANLDTPVARTFDPIRLVFLHSPDLLFNLDRFDSMFEDLQLFRHRHQHRRLFFLEMHARKGIEQGLLVIPSPPPPAPPPLLLEGRACV